MKKQLIIASFATVVGVAGLTGIGVANAATDTSSTSPMSGLVEAIASKFSLDKTEVQAVFDAQRSVMEATREAESKEKLAALVTEGKLTQDQADKITAKRAEIKKEREADRASDEDKSGTDRKAEMDARKTALEAWAKENNISTDYLYLVMGGGGHGHRPGGDMGGRMQMSMGTSSSESSTSSQ